MARFRCVCGEVLVTSGEIPNPTEWLCLSASGFEAFTGQVDAEAVYLGSTLMYRCPTSDHLWVYWRGFDEPPSLYGPQPLPQAR
ncbi:MAG: hypothetical protein LWW77_01445 [Propionibacteriales bacterium]|nr:hypothetical protein [Propionibacteriales bacterium]